MAYNKQLTGWRRRFLVRVNRLEEIADYLCKQEGREEYATGLLDAIEMIEVFLMDDEKDTNHNFDTTGITEPAVLGIMRGYVEKELAKKDAPASISIDPENKIGDD